MFNITVLSEIAFIDNGNGFFSLHTKFGDMIVNEMGKFIIDNLPKYNINEITDRVMDKYGMSAEEANKKVEEYLYQLRNVEIVEFSDTNITTFQNGILQVAGEKSYRMICNDILDNLNSERVIYSSVNSTKYYNIYALRSRSFSQKENYFYTINHNGAISIVGIQNLDSLTSPVIISFLKYGEIIEDLDQLYDEVVVQLKKMNQYKIRISINDLMANEFVKDFILKKGFQLEGVLRKEDGVNDYYLYARMI